MQHPTHGYSFRIIAVGSDRAACADPVRVVGRVMTPPLLSIVIPALNEAEALPALLADLQPWRHSGVEVVLADGGSTDATVALARAAGVPVAQSPRGRALQLNAGARLATGQHLLFVHADTLLPPDGVPAVQRALRAGGDQAWGRFDVAISGSHPMLRVIAWFMNHRSRLTGVATGDQALFMTRQVFEAVGGFPEQPLMEDIEISARLGRLARPACLRQRVTTSGRRWTQRGVWRTMVLMWQLRWAYWRGASPESLARRYR